MAEAAVRVQIRPVGALPWVRGFHFGAPSRSIYDAQADAQAAWSRECDQNREARILLDGHVHTLVRLLDKYERKEPLSDEDVQNRFRIKAWHRDYSLAKAQEDADLAQKEIDRNAEWAQDAAKRKAEAHARLAQIQERINKLTQNS